MVPQSENEYTCNDRGEKYRPLQDEESQGKGDIETGNTKAGEDVYYELDERFIQPEKDNWHGKPDKGISSPNTQADKGKWHGMQNKGRSLPNAKEGEYDDVVPQTDKGKWHGMQNKGRSLPNAREGEYDDMVPQTGKSQSHGKQETGKRRREASEDQCDDIDDGYLLPQSVKRLLHGGQETGKCSPGASEGKHESHGKQGHGQRSSEAVKDRGNETPVYDDTV